MQGVGYRYYAQRNAAQLGLGGYAANLADGRVEVYARGARDAVAELARRLGRGPMWSDVRNIEELEAEPESCTGFHIRD